MKRYRAVLMDADDTLFDFHAAEARALLSVVGALPLDPQRACARYHEINAACWADFEQGKVTQPQLRLRRFREFVEEFGLEEDPVRLAEAYTEALSRQAPLLPEALAVCRALAARYPLALVTNGIPQVQRGRLARSPLNGLFQAVVISEEVGSPKPEPQMLTIALERLGGIPPQEALMVGDSLRSDMRAGLNAGVDTCWVNAKKAPRPQGMALTYEIERLSQLLEILL